MSNPMIDSSKLIPKLLDSILFNKKKGDPFSNEQITDLDEEIDESQFYLNSTETENQN